MYIHRRISICIYISLYIYMHLSRMILKSHHSSNVNFKSSEYYLTWNTLRLDKIDTSIHAVNIPVLSYEHHCLWLSGISWDNLHTLCVEPCSEKVKLSSSLEFACVMLIWDVLAACTSTYIYIHKTKYTYVFIYSDIQALNMYIYDIYDIWYIYIHALYRFSNQLYYLIPTSRPTHPFPPLFLRWILMEHPQISPMATRACASSCKETTRDPKRSMETTRVSVEPPVGFVGFGFGGGGFLGWFVEEVSDEKWKKKGPGKFCLVGYFLGDEILPGEYIIYIIEQVRWWVGFPC